MLEHPAGQNLPLGVQTKQINQLIRGAEEVSGQVLSAEGGGIENLPLVRPGDLIPPGQRRHQIQ